MPSLLEDGRQLVSGWHAGHEPTGLHEGLFNSKLKSIEVGALSVGSFLVWRPGLRTPLQVGPDQTGKWTEGGEKAKGSRGPANHFIGAKGMPGLGWGGKGNTGWFLSPYKD